MLFSGTYFASQLIISSCFMYIKNYQLRFLTFFDFVVKLQQLMSLGFKGQRRALVSNEFVECHGIKSRDQGPWRVAARIAANPDIPHFVVEDIVRVTMDYLLHARIVQDHV